MGQRYLKIRIPLLFFLAAGILFFGIGLFILLMRTPSDRVGIYFGEQIIVKQVPPHVPLQVDDVILGIGPLEVNANLLTPGYWQKALFAPESTQGATYTILRDGEIMHIDIPWGYYSARTLLWRGGALWIVGLGVLVTVFIILSERARPLENRLLARFFAMVSLIQINNMLPTSGANVALTWSWLFMPVDIVAIWVGLSSFVHAVLIFPELKAPLRRLPWLRWVIHLITPLASIALALLLGVNTVLGIRARMFMVTNSLMMVGMLVGLGSLGHTYITTQQPGVRNQIRWIIWGLAISMLPWITLYAVPSVIFGKPWVPLNITNIALIALPLGFMVSILRYGLLDIDLLVNRTLVYTLSMGILALVYLAVVSAIRSIILQSTGMPNDYLAGILATLAVFVVFNPLRLYVERIVDRAFYKEQLDLRQVLHEINERLSTTIFFSDVLNLLTRQVAQRLGLSHATLLLLGGEGQRVYTVDGPDAFHGEVGATVIDWLRAHNQPLLLYEAHKLPQNVQAAAKALAGAGVEVCLPLRHHNELLGLYLFGHKRSRNLLNRQEVDTLVLLGHQAATVLKNAQLYRELQDYNRLLETRVEARTAELLAERNRLDTILQNIADGLVVTDREGHIVMVNPAFAHMIGTSASDILLGRALPDVLPSDKLISLAERALEHSGEVFSENIAVTLAGPTVIAEETPTRVYKASACALRRRRDFAPDIAKSPPGEHFNQQEGLGVVTILRDVTHEHEVDRMKTEFISTVSHELRTPLTSVLGFAKLISKIVDRDILPRIAEDDRPGQRSLKRIRDNLHIIVSEGERLTRLINDVLDIAKMDAGKIEWHMTDVDIEDIIHTAAAATSALASEKGLPMHVDIEKALPTVHADRDRLIQVMTNLLSNAIKFTDRGQIEVRAFKTQLARDCSASPPVEGLGQQLRYLDAGQWLAITVKDSGIGIAKEEFSQTFEKFRQVGDLDVLTGRPKGTGLGLPICKEIVEHHSGRIGVESEQGVGSTFAFVLPLAPETVEVVRPEVIGVPHAGSKPTALDIAESEPLILVVEDEDNIRNLLHQILNEAGYPMIEAADGMQALKQARHMHPDLIICDIMIPGISGFDVVSVLKGDPQTSDIPILILSVVEDRERGFRLGADAYLNKPVDTEQLLASITRLLSHDAPDHKRALIIGEDKAFVEKNRPRLRAHGYEVAFALDLHEGLALMQQDETTLLVLDEAVARLNDYGMLKVLKTKRAFHNVKVTVLLPSASSEAITEMRRQGADWCGVPEDLEYYLQEVQVLEKGGGNA